MLFDYPPGVTGKMIDRLECIEPPETCENCKFYEERTCGYICSLLEAEYLPKELNAMNDEQYMSLFSKDKDDSCNEFKCFVI